jgi:glycosyltransferase involved in cell wall biosynthesis
MNNQQLIDNYPLVSVIIPAYNAETFVEKTLKSVLSQTYKNLEVLVVDDGSEDRTTEIVKAIAQQDRRVILLHQKNLGVAAARNSGIQKSKGEFIAPIDADDIWYPQNIEKQVQCMLQADSSVGLVYSWSVDIDEQDIPTGEFRATKIEGKVYKTLLCHNFLGNASAALIRRVCFEKVGYYNCQLKEQNAQGCEDWELYLRIAEFYQFKVVPEFFIGYRKISSSMSRDYRQMAKSHALMLQSIRQKYPQIPTFLYRLSSSSFYIYLARQSSQFNNHHSTLFWLYRALQADFITPLWRYGFYTLLIKNFLGLIIEQIVSQKNLNGNVFGQGKRCLKSKDRLMTIVKIEKRRLSIKFKLLVGNLLHRSIDLMI